MNDELVKFVAVYVMVILPLTMWAIEHRFKGHDKEIRELKKRIDKLEKQSFCNYENNKRQNI